MLKSKEMDIFHITGKGIILYYNLFGKSSGEIYLNLKCTYPLVQKPVIRLNTIGVQVSVQFSSVQSLSRVRLFVTPWIAARQASPSITNSRSSLKLMSIDSYIAYSGK